MITKLSHTETLAIPANATDEVVTVNVPDDQEWLIQWIRKQNVGADLTVKSIQIDGDGIYGNIDLDAGSEYGTLHAHKTVSFVVDNAAGSEQNLDMTINGNRKIT